MSDNSGVVEFSELHAWDVINHQICALCFSSVSFAVFHYGPAAVLHHHGTLKNKHCSVKKNTRIKVVTGNREICPKHPYSTWHQTRSLKQSLNICFEVWSESFSFPGFTTGRNSVVVNWKKKKKKPYLMSIHRILSLLPLCASLKKWEWMWKKKHILQNLSQGIKQYWNTIHKYDKYVITVTEWN